ncbi:MAG: hypothetical protein NDF55_11345 [archaeon GB-1867-005]|nr:hypothetical protein [Candidatus Culexmicrobium cathedralense]
MVVISGASGATVLLPKATDLVLSQFGPKTAPVIARFFTVLPGEPPDPKYTVQSS